MKPKYLINALFAILLWTLAGLAFWVNDYSKTMTPAIVGLVLTFLGWMAWSADGKAFRDF